MPIHFEPGDDHVVTITIDRSEARNSLDMEHFFQLRQAWERFDADDELWVAIITGVGPDFCVGADLKTYIPEITKLSKRISAGETTDIGGYQIDDGVKMEPKRGLFAGGGTTVRLPRQIAFPAAMEMLLCADQISAQRAFSMGVLNEVCHPGELMERALAYASRITSNGPLAVRKTKESVLRGLATTMSEAYKIESEISSEVFASEDATEGPKAFAEKRPPVWKNR